MWLCKCGLVNSGLNTKCADSKGQHIQTTVNSPDYLMAVVATKDLHMTQDEREKLFEQFFNKEKIVVKDMDDFQLAKNIEVLESIALEAKARVSAADWERRERRAKTGNKDWLATVESPNQAVSDAINTVKTRQARMSKMDKIRQQLRDSGIAEEIVNEMVLQLEKRATENTVKTINFPVTKVEFPSTEATATATATETSDSKSDFIVPKLKFGS
jgi:hypothetical protein